MLDGGSRLHPPAVGNKSETNSPTPPQAEAAKAGLFPNEIVAVAAPEGLAGEIGPEHPAADAPAPGHAPAPASKASSYTLLPENDQGHSLEPQLDNSARSPRGSLPGSAGLPGDASSASVPGDAGLGHGFGSLPGPLGLPMPGGPPGATPSPSPGPFGTPAQGGQPGAAPSLSPGPFGMPLQGGLSAAPAVSVPSRPAAPKLPAPLAPTPSLVPPETPRWGDTQRAPAASGPSATTPPDAGPRGQSPEAAGRPTLDGSLGSAAEEATMANAQANTDTWVAADARLALLGSAPDTASAGPPTRGLFSSMPALANATGVAGALADGTPASLGMQVTLAMASLAESSLHASQPLYQPSKPTLSDLASLEPSALGTARLSIMAALPSTVPSPVLALIAGDMFRVQTQRLELMYASRAMDENGEPPPLDADEAIMRQRAIKEVDMGGMWPWHLTPRPPAGAAPEEAAPAHNAFRAAFFTAALQTPAAVLPMFQNEQVRFYRRGPAGYQPIWVPQRPTKAFTSLQAGTDDGSSWIALAERAFLSLPEAPPADQLDGPSVATVLQTLLGRDARAVPVIGDAQSALLLWKQVCRTSAPYHELMLAVTLPPPAGTGDVQMVYGVLGAYKHQGVHVVQMCNPLSGNVFMLPFAEFRRNIEIVCILTGLQLRR